MGIKNLTQLILKKSPNSIQTAGIYTLKDKKIAIDTSILIYKSLTNVRYNNEYLKNKEGKIVSHIIGLFNRFKVTKEWYVDFVTPITSINSSIVYEDFKVCFWSVLYWLLVVMFILPVPSKNCFIPLRVSPSLCSVFISLIFFTYDFLYSALVLFIFLGGGNNPDLI